MTAKRKSWRARRRHRVAAYLSKQPMGVPGNPAPTEDRMRRIDVNVDVAWISVVVLFASGTVLLIAYLFFRGRDDPNAVRFYLLGITFMTTTVAFAAAILRFLAHAKKTYGFVQMDGLGKALAVVATGIAGSGTVAGILALACGLQA